MFRDTDEALMDAAFVDDDPRLAGHRPSRLPVGSALAMTTVDGAEPMMCATVRPATPSGRIELFSRDLEDRFGYGLPRYEPVERSYPLTIISPSSAKRTNATFGNCALSAGSEEVEVNPADAGPRGISDGDALRVYNDRGETRLVAKVTDAVLPGVLYTPKGVWLSGSPTGPDRERAARRRHPYRHRGRRVLQRGVLRCGAGRVTNSLDARKGGATGCNFTHPHGSIFPNAQTRNRARSPSSSRIAA